jgi:hypothetical protein
MSLDEDSLLKPFRQMTGAAAPGAELGGWYSYDPVHIGIEEAYAPSATFGQWVSALARMYAIRRSPAIRARLMRLNRLYAQTISGSYFEVNRFPAYCLDKLICGLSDAHEFAADPEAFAIMQRATDAALPHLPGLAASAAAPSRTGSTGGETGTRPTTTMSPTPLPKISISPGSEVPARATANWPTPISTRPTSSR